MILENKQTRQFVIREILINQSISNQNKLRIALKKHGFKVTQATLSRDLKELGVSRFSTQEGAKYIPQQSESIKILRPLIGEEVVAIKNNEALIVVVTLPGCASVVGEYVDVQKNPDIIGTIAGDNTLMVIPSSVKKINSVMTFLKEKLIEGKE
jgi:transcriptional regulator of arginine metabolism